MAYTLRPTASVKMSAAAEAVAEEAPVAEEVVAEEAAKEVEKPAKTASNTPDPADTTCYPGLKPVTEDAPALKPVTDDAPALEAVTAGGETLSSIKEFPEEEPAPADAADWNVSTKEPVPEGIDAWKTPFPHRKIERNGESNLDDRSKKATKNLAPIGRVDPNGFAALLGTDVDEEDLAGVGSDAPPSSTTPAGALSRPRRTVQTEPTSTRSGLRFGRTFCSTSKLLCVFLTVAIGLGCSAFALSSYGSGGVSDLIESVFVPDAASIPALDLSDTTPDVTADPASTPALMPHLDERRLNVDDKDDVDDADAEDDDAEDDDAEDDDAESSDHRWSTPSTGTINGVHCDNPVITGNHCVAGAPHHDPEGMVCDNDGTAQEAYCSYDLGSTACAYCA